MTSDGPVCMIAGVGPGTGRECARRFAAGGYRVAMLARDRNRLETYEQEIARSKGFVCDVADIEALTAAAAAVAEYMGAPRVLIHNAVSGILDGGGAATFLESEPTRLERNFRVNATSLLYLARAVAPAMIEAGDGAIIVTGNTSARRGRARFAYFAPTKAAQRILAESMARELGPKGVHVAYLMVDAAIRYTAHTTGVCCRQTRRILLQTVRHCRGGIPHRTSGSFGVVIQRRVTARYRNLVIRHNDLPAQLAYRPRQPLSTDGTSPQTASPSRFSTRVVTPDSHITPGIALTGHMQAIGTRTLMNGSKRNTLCVSRQAV